MGGDNGTSSYRIRGRKKDEGGKREGHAQREGRGIERETAGYCVPSAQRCKRKRATEMCARLPSSSSVSIVNGAS